MQKGGCLVSIIVPIYNVEEYLEKCVKSIIKQSYKCIEIILVDDGSTDGSAKICDKYKMEDKRIQVIHKDNGGLVSARKVGLTKAAGKYIGFVDGDDYIDEDMFSILVDNMENTGADFVHSGFACKQNLSVCLENSVIDLKFKEEREEFLREYVLDYMSEKCISPSIWSKLFNSKLIKESYCWVPDSQSIGEDLVNLVECVMRSKKISLINLAAYHYTTREGSLTNLDNIKDLSWQIDLHKVIEESLKRHACYDKEKSYLDNLIIHFIWHSLRRKLKNKFVMSEYLFENIEKLFNKKIILYGAGEVGRDYYLQISHYQKCHIVAWVDSNYKNIHYDCADIFGIECLNEIDYDYIVIAIKKEKRAQEIKKRLIDDGISSSKIIWSKPQSICRING